MTENDLRWRLRQLPREIEPGRDLWAGIQASIQRPPVERRPRHWLAGMAMAASVLLAAGLFWKSGALVAPTIPDPASAVVSAESQAITREYQAALRQFDGAPIAAQLSPSLGELDRSVIQIQRAIEADPDSVFLLQQLRKAYSRRLALTQRAVVS